MKNIENVVRQLLNLDYTYEHIYNAKFENGQAKSMPTGYVYYKAEDLLPVLQAMEKEVNE